MDPLIIAPSLNSQLPRESCWSLFARREFSELIDFSKRLREDHGHVPAAGGERAMEFRIRYQSKVFISIVINLFICYYYFVFVLLVIEFFRGILLKHDDEIKRNCGGY